SLHVLFSSFLRQPQCVTLSPYTTLFRSGVLLDDLGQREAALEAYQSATEEDPTLADCHYNLARLYESMGKSQHAIRHLGLYRKIDRKSTRLNSSHVKNSYDVFCLQNKNQ